MRFLKFDPFDMALVLYGSCLYLALHGERKRDRVVAVVLTVIATPVLLPVLLIGAVLVLLTPKGFKQ
jgi:hypothetical protein